MKHIIYQVLTRLWRNGRFSAWDDASFDYVKSLGAGWIWYTGIPRHASGQDFVKGDPGSPYSICDWKDVNPYLADDPERRLEEFRGLVARTHRAGLKLIIDYIPNHVSRDYSGPIRHFDYCDWDWTDTYKNDWGDPATIEAMKDILCWWASMGVDGFRCDMVELVPPERLREVIASVRARYPELLFVAEVYEKRNYGCYLVYVGFDLLYDKSGMYDTLRAVVCSGESAQAVTRCWQETGGMQPRMLYFLENHDEQRLASPQFAGSPETGYAALAAAALFNTASFMLYFGQETGENAAEGAEGRTSIFNWCSPRCNSVIDNILHGNAPDSCSAAVLERYRTILGYASQPLFAGGGNWDLGYVNGDSAGFDPARHFAFIRYTDSRAALVFCNFSGEDASAVLRIPAEMQEHTHCGIFPVRAGANDASVYFFE